MSGHFDPDVSIAHDQVGVVIGFLAQGRNLIDEFHRAAERRELPGPDEHVAMPFPIFGLRQPLEDLGFAKLLHESTLIRSGRGSEPCSRPRVGPPLEPLT